VQNWLQSVDPPRPGKGKRQSIILLVAQWTRRELVDEASEPSTMTKVEILFVYLARHDWTALSEHPSRPLV